jgi:hypothetical protein
VSISLTHTQKILLKLPLSHHHRRVRITCASPGESNSFSARRCHHYDHHEENPKQSQNECRCYGDSRCSTAKRRALTKKIMKSARNEWTIFLAVECGSAFVNNDGNSNGFFAQKKQLLRSPPTVQRTTKKEQRRENRFRMCIGNQVRVCIST